MHSGINGGEIPIVGATVTVYAAGAGGYGSAPTSLGQTTTDKDGNFTIAKFSCPAPDAQIYLVASGGSVNGNTANLTIVFLTAVGACGQLAFSDGVFSTDLDELTTFASAYALVRFMNPSNPQQIGTVARYPAGLA
ncbi:MAG: MBG domain-containing protein, partial [Candidatus Binataceae bacterium]